MANSGPGSEGIDIAWKRMQAEIREAQRRALEGEAEAEPEDAP